MIPNSAIVTAVIDNIEIYTRQADHNVLTLVVESAVAKGEKKFLFNKDDDHYIRALINNADLKNAALKKGQKINAELTKVNYDLWKIIGFL